MQPRSSNNLGSKTHAFVVFSGSFRDIVRSQSSALISKLSNIKDNSVKSALKALHHKNK